MNVSYLGPNFIPEHLDVISVYDEDNTQVLGRAAYEFFIATPLDGKKIVDSPSSSI